MASQNRTAVAYEANQYCQSTSGGVTIKFVNPQGRYDVSETVQEQWVSLEKLAISTSQTGDARLVTLEGSTYRLELPAGATCY